MTRKITEFWFPILTVSFIVLGPVLFLWVPNEIIRWQVAGALEQIRSGQNDQAIENLDKLLKSNPNNTLIRRTFLQAISESKQQDRTLETIALFDKTMPDSKALPNSLHWKKQKADAYHNIGEHKKAFLLNVEVMKEQEENLSERHEAFPTIYPEPKKSISVWNDLTYFSALASSGRSPGDEIIKPFLSGLKSKMGTGWEMQFIRTRCLALTQVDQNERAYNLLQNSLRKFKEILKDEQKRLTEEAGEWIVQTKFPGQKEPTALHDRRRNVAAMRFGLKSLARLQIDLLKNTGRQSKVEEYLNSWKNLFLFDDLDSEQQNPSARILCNNLKEQATYLDTRGFARMKIAKWNHALDDLDSAIEAAELATALQKKAHLFNNHNQVDKRDIELERKRFRRAKAIYYYHRSLIHIRQENPLLAQHDQEMVKDLGFKAGKDLF